MSRTIPSTLAAHSALPARTECFLLKVKPKSATVFGVTELNRDVTYDDGSGDGAIVYRSKTGYTSFDTETKSDLSVNNSEAASLIAQYPMDGMTKDAIGRGDYDGARFFQYLVNYADLTMGHTIIGAGQVGKITIVDEMACTIELRSFTQVLKQLSMVELTSITCRAQYGDTRCKQPLRWYAGTVAFVGAENDRTFVLTLAPGFTIPPGSSSGTITGCPFFTGDGTAVTAQLKDTAGEAITSGFTVTNVKIAGTVYAGVTISGSGLVTFAAAPGAGAIVTWDGTLTSSPDGFFVPGLVHWDSGNNVGFEQEVEQYVSATGTVTLAIPAYYAVQVGDNLRIRRDCDKSKTMCKAYGNYPNMRAETELPRGNAVSLQSPEQTLPASGA